MPPMSDKEKGQAREKLTAAGCPSELMEKLTATTPWAVIQAILAFIAAHPGLAADFWALLQAILAGGGLPPVPTP